MAKLFKCFTGALLVFGAQIYTTWALPYCICGRNLLPVCGSDGKTYSNECSLECVAYTSKTKITIAKFGPCQQSSPKDSLRNICLCSFEESPVCGSDGQTYRNECGLNCHRARFNQLLTIKYAGFCKNVEEPPCVCSVLVNPVCGSDGNTYDNVCLLNCATKEDSLLRIEYQGPCRDSVNVAGI